MEDHFFAFWSAATQHAAQGSRVRCIQIVDVSRESAMAVAERLRDEAGIQCKDVSISTAGFSGFLAVTKDAWS